MPGDAPGFLRVGGVLASSDIWIRYKERFVSPAGRVVDTGNGGTSHSEGQGYGLLLAVAADDRETFDSILAWTNQNLFIRDDNLAAWTVAGERASEGANDAADGDILIAWALAEAADLWKDPKYLARARAMARDIAAELIKADRRFGLLLAPAVHGFSAAERPDGPIVNPSYWIFPAFARLKQIYPEADWGALAASGLALIDRAIQRPGQLPGDWISLGPSSAPSAGDLTKEFRYNAVRIPLYAFWGGAAAPRLMQAVTDSTTGGDGHVAPGGDLATIFAEPGYRKIWALARCAAAGERYPAEFYTFEKDQNYYPATLSALSMVAAANRGGPCLDRDAMGALLGGRWPAPASRLGDFDGGLAGEAGGTALKPVLAASQPLFVAPPVPRATPGASASSSWPLGPIAAGVAGAGLFAGVAALVWWRRRAETQRMESIFAPVEGHIGSEISRAAPRCLPSNPFLPTGSLETLGRQIDNAAAASVEYGRTLGVIYFRLDEWSVADAELEALLARLRDALRKTDCVAAINPREIIICVSLLPGLTELNTIANRLQDIGKEWPRFRPAFEIEAGLAIYPMCGYRAEELIAHARARRESREMELQAPPSRTSQSNTKSASKRGSKKKQRPASQLSHEHRVSN